MSETANGANSVVVVTVTPDTPQTVPIPTAGAGGAPASATIIDRYDFPRGAISITKTSSGANPVPLAGAVFTVTGPVTTTGVTTDANGIACLSPLPFGSYTVTETAAPPGYVLDPTPHPVTVNAVATSCSDATAAKLTVTDTPQRGAIKVTKNSNATPPAPLQGAGFAIRDAGGALIATLTTGTDGTACRADLPFGTYTVTEVAPPPG